jgi:hypothetical protein
MHSKAWNFGMRKKNKIIYPEIEQKLLSIFSLQKKAEK